MSYRSSNGLLPLHVSSVTRIVAILLVLCGATVVADTPAPTECEITTLKFTETIPGFHIIKKHRILCPTGYQMVIDNERLEHVRCQKGEKDKEWFVKMRTNHDVGEYRFENKTRFTGDRKLRCDKIKGEEKDEKKGGEQRTPLGLHRQHLAKEKQTQVIAIVIAVLIALLLIGAQIFALHGYEKAKKMLAKKEVVEGANQEVVRDSKKDVVADANDDKVTQVGETMAV